MFIKNLYIYLKSLLLNPVASSTHINTNNFILLGPTEENGLLTSKSLLEELGSGEKVLRVEDFTLPTITSWDSVLIPILEIKNEELEEKLKSIKIFNELNERKLSKHSFIQSTSGNIIKGNDTKIRGFEENAKLFILENSRYENLLLCAFFSLTHESFFAFREKGFHFGTYHTTDCFLWHTISTFGITFNFELEELKIFLKKCKLNINNTKDFFVIIDSGLTGPVKINYSYDSHITAKPIVLNTNIYNTENSSVKNTELSQRSTENTGSSENKASISIIVILIILVAGLFGYFFCFKLSQEVGED
ncbi:hypothetical protein CDIK_0045 [Cucumispora dikerogammari]|nr:hypothetical protein CDIK_0045 [Cucumispora dikerogammari]